MKLLAIDTSASHCAVCVLDDAAGTAHRDVRDIGTGHAEVLMGQIAGVLKQAHLTWSDLERIAVCVGPGSFTGVRVGVSAARGLALALGIPAVGVTTLEAIAADAAPLAGGRPILAAIDARRGQLYFQPFDDAGVATADPRAVPVEQALAMVQSDTVVAGNGAAVLGADGAVLADAASGDIGTIARLAAARAPGAAPVPLYLRSADAKPQTGFALPRAEHA